MTARDPPIGEDLNVEATLVAQPPAEPQERRRTLKAVLVFLLSLGTIGLGITGAIFTDTEPVTGNTFTTGTIDLATSPTSAVVSFTDMAPGDTDLGELTVSNAGSLEYRYAVRSTATENVLAAQLDLTVWPEANEIDAIPNTTCEFANKPLTPLYGAADLGSTTGVNLIGDPAQGAQTGDRTLAATASEKLCFHVSLPLSTGNTYQDVTTTATFTFEAEQTANNA
ncbi:MAG TPA: TasA family protein [Nitriliruptorales bacterium]|nr:TasA family protein [Nitriliruptorales bacterium]